MPGKSEAWQRLQALFRQAAPLERDGRDALIAEACGDDAELKARLEEMLDAHDRSGPLESPPPTVSIEADLRSPAGLPEPIEGYEIVRELHRGGQGVVYQAVQKSTKRKVAI